MSTCNSHSAEVDKVAVVVSGRDFEVVFGEEDDEDLDGAEVGNDEGVSNSHVESST